MNIAKGGAGQRGLTQEGIGYDPRSTENKYVTLPDFVNLCDPLLIKLSWETLKSMSNHQLHEKCD